MKVLLATPPSKYIVRDMAGGLGFDSGPENVLPPLDLLLLATVLQKKREKVKIIDCLAEKENKINFVQTAKQFSPTHFLIVVSLPTLENDCQFIALLKKNFPKSFIVAKFPLEEKKLLSEVLEKSKADLCLFSENELLVDKILQKKETGGTASFQRGKLKVGKKRILLDLNQLALPDRKLLKNNLYHYRLLGSQPTTIMQTSRGCPMPCAFYCPYPLVQGTKWRARSPKHVIKELVDIVQKHKIKNILFRDATFTLNRRHTLEICKLIQKNNLNFRWWCETRVNCLDYELLKIMRKVGLVGINIGVESGDERLLAKEAKPGVSLIQLTKVKFWCDQLKIKLHFLLMIGLPNDSRKSIWKTYLLLKKLKPHSMGLTIATPYPGTLFYQLAKKRNWIKTFDWEKYGGHNAVMDTKYLTTQDLEFAYQTINKLFYLSKHKSIKNKVKLFLKEREFERWVKQ